MKQPLIVLLALAAMSAMAQPQSPHDATREERAAQREYGRQHQYDPIDDRRQRWEQRRYCREWRERVERHPRLRLPRECWR